MRLWLENGYKKIQYRIADSYQSTGDNKKACSAIEKVLEYDPLSEESVERLISLKLMIGDSVMAAKIYHEYEHRLLKEMKMAPSNRLKEKVAGIIR
jgi:two-component SAPR family response regulator